MINVLKFGGSALDSLDDYRKTARYISDKIQKTPGKCVVVASAQKGMTDKLMFEGQKLNQLCSGSAYDNLMAVGEMQSIALLSMAIEAEGLSCESLNGYQLGIVSDGVFSHASVRSVNPEPILSALESVQVVVVAGGQAVSDSGQLTYLGRNSSDLTAAIITKALSLFEFDVFSNIPNIYAADPHFITQPYKFRKIAYHQIQTMCQLGAKVVHPEALSIAQANKIRITRRGLDGSIGTVIGDDSDGGQPMLVLDCDAILLKYTQVEYLNEAKKALSTANVEYYSFIIQDFYLCVTARGIKAEQLIEKYNLSGQICHMETVIASVSLSNKIDFHVVKRDKATALAQSYYEQLQFKKDKSIQCYPIKTSA